MAYEDRDRGRGPWRSDDRDQNRGRDAYGRSDRDDDRGFFDRAGDEVRSWFGDENAEQRRERDHRDDYGAQSSYDRNAGRSFDRGYGRDPHDRNPGAHTNYYAGGDRGQSRVGPEGGFEQRSDFRRDERYAQSGQASARRPEQGAEQGARGFGQGGYEREESRYGRDQQGGQAQRSAFGSGSATADSSWGDRNASQNRQNHDPHYSEWRNRQIETFDRDYDEYRREHSSKFDQEFGTWRSKRQEQRQSLGKVIEHQEVVGSDGQHVGKVDKVRGDRIILAKNDADAGGHHHSIPCSWVDQVTDKVTLNRTADQAQQSWRDEERSRALFEPEDQGQEGPHALDRAFSGTYSRDRDS